MRTKGRQGEPRDKSQRNLELMGNQTCKKTRASVKLGKRLKRVCNEEHRGRNTELSGLKARNTDTFAGDNSEDLRLYLMALTLRQRRSGCMFLISSTANELNELQLPFNQSYVMNR